MKKTIIITITLLMMTAAMFAQTSIVTATVTQTALSISDDADVVIGDVTKNVDAVLTPTSDGTASSGGSVLTFGKISISGEEGFAVDVTPPLVATLSNGTSTMDFTPNVVGSTSATQPNIAGSTALTNNTANTVSLSGLSGAGGTGDYYLYIGGTLVVGATQSPGAYTSASGAGAVPLTFTIAYN